MDKDKNFIYEKTVNHPSHYNKHPSGVECIEITKHFNHCLGAAIDYIWRADYKQNAIEDLEKAIWFLQTEIERRMNMKEDK